ncbi:MAG: hypothetical protein JRD89_09590 [Deltaproteobacteria bacterium]|nr:hypothetical protein [Deltaproteobacteria bacterium]
MKVSDRRDGNFGETHDLERKRQGLYPESDDGRQGHRTNFFDHIIIGNDDYFSFADKGFIGEYATKAIKEL